MFAPRISCLATMCTTVYFIEDVTLTAFRCAGYLLATKTRKKNEKVKPKEDSEADHDDIPFLMKDIVVRFNGFFCKSYNLWCIPERREGGRCL